MTCSNKTWNETLYVIWTIQLKYRNECQISLDDRGRGVDTCKDGKSLTYTSSTQSYLHIPDFTNGDEGVYKCESVYKGGSERYEINVAITGMTFLLTRTEDHVINKTAFSVLNCNTQKNV